LETGLISGQNILGHINHLFTCFFVFDDNEESPLPLKGAENMGFKMKHSTLLAISAGAALLAGCASNGQKPPRVMSVHRTTTAQVALTVICERPNGPPFTYVVSSRELRQQATEYAKTLTKAARKKQVLATDYVPQSYTVANGWDTLALAYKPYIDDVTGYTRIVGTVTCGHLQGVSPENRFSYATGSISYPLNITALETMTQPQRWNGVGGYTTSISVERPTVQTMR